MKILISGASGLIGKNLSSRLSAQGHEIYKLTRAPKGSRDVGWSLHTKSIDWKESLEVDGVIHLAGESIADGRWTDEKKQKIYSSRVEGTALLVSKISSLPKPPEFFISASAVGFYGDRGEENLSENSSSGDNFLAKVCRDWEDASGPLQDVGVRVCHTRFGLVLSKEGGALEKMRQAYKMGLGASIGDGSQWVSWVDIEDHARAIEFLITKPMFSGAFNLSSPHPERQKDFSEKLSRILNRPHFLKAPSFAIKLLLGEMADELLLPSIKALPTKFLNAGFEFKYPRLEESLSHLLN